MDIMGIAKLSTSIAETGIKQEVGITMLKRAQEMQASTATQLLEAVDSAAPTQNLPGHLGKHINTSA